MISDTLSDLERLALALCLSGWALSFERSDRPKASWIADSFVRMMGRKFEIDASVAMEGDDLLATSADDPRRRSLVVRLGVPETETLRLGHQAAFAQRELCRALDQILGADDAIPRPSGLEIGDKAITYNEVRDACRLPSVREPAAQAMRDVYLRALLDLRVRLSYRKSQGVDSASELRPISSAFVIRRSHSSFSWPADPAAYWNGHHIKPSLPTFDVDGLAHSRLLIKLLYAVVEADTRLHQKGRGYTEPAGEPSRPRLKSSDAVGEVIEHDLTPQIQDLTGWTPNVAGKLAREVAFYTLAIRRLCLENASIREFRRIHAD